MQDDKTYSHFSTQQDPLGQKYYMQKMTDDFDIQSMQTAMHAPSNMINQTSAVTNSLLQKVAQFEHRLKHAENTLKLQDDLFRLKKEESMMSDKIEKQTQEQMETK